MRAGGAEVKLTGSCVGADHDYWRRLHAVVRRACIV
jgi:hypothetical protein